MNFLIKQLSDLTGISSETIRYYRQVNILHPEFNSKGFYSYSYDDFITLLYTREMKTYSQSINTIKDFYQSKSILDLSIEFDKYHQILNTHIYSLQLELQRLEESQKYIKACLRLFNKVEEFDGPSTWAYPILEQTNKEDIKKWTMNFPFVYTSITIPLESLNNSNLPLKCYPGVGALIHHVEKFNLPISEKCFFQDGGHFIRTCIKTKNPNNISKEDLKVLYDYAKLNLLTFRTCSGGRVVFIDYQEKTPTYYLLIWIGVY